MDDVTLQSVFQIFSILAVPLGYAMQFLYNLLQNYGWAIIVFTILVRILMFPLSLRQQKSTARNAAYQPMMQEIQKKWANDRARQSEELQKFQEENNIKMSAGCLPMIVNMVVLFSIIAVIQAPLTYILRMPAEEVQAGVAIVEFYDGAGTISKNAYTMESLLIGEIINNPARFEEGIDAEGENSAEQHVAMDPEWVDAVVNFKFEFMGMNLAAVPSHALGIYLILPILSLLTMVGSQIIIMRTSGTPQQGMGSMLAMTVVMGALFGYYAFTIPVGFSLYYTMSNLVMTGQQLIVRRIYSPDEAKKQVLAEIEERKKAKKAKKQVKVREEDGSVVVRELSEAELAKLRLARARQLDSERYAEDPEDKEKDAAAMEKARQLDKAADAQPAADGTDEPEEGNTPEQADEPAEAAEAAQSEAAKAKAAEEAPAAEAPAIAAAQGDNAPKPRPGRRRRATLSQKDDEAKDASNEVPQRQEGSSDA